MAIEVDIDWAKRRVLATPRGTLTNDDLFDYQEVTWSRPELAGFNELVDMRWVDEVAFRSSGHVVALAALSATMDAPAAPTKLAIVATQDLHFGLARMYQAYRASDTRSTKIVEVFRSLEEALAWLDEAEP
jgi:hypothetical protein